MPASKSRALAAPAKRVCKTATKAKPAAAAIEPPTCELACFQDGGGAFPNFKYFRYWWRGDGDRPSMIPLIEKKLRPGDDPKFGVAAKFDLLLPDAAPGDYLDLSFLLERYEERQQPWEPAAFVQLNFYPRDGQSALGLFEQVRSFCRAQFAMIGCPTIITLHVPAYAGHDNEPHCHAQILPRVLGPLGFAGWQRDLACDAGNRAIYSAWARSIR